MAEDSSFRVKNTLVVNGSFVANSTVVNAAAITATSVNATSVNTATANVTTSIVVGSNVTINTSTAFVGNTTVNTSITAGQISISGVTVNSTIYRGTANNANNLNGQPASFYTNATNLATGTVPTARLGSGTANSTTFLAGDQSYKTAVTSVATGSGLSGGPITTTGTVSVVANTGIVANATGVFVNAAYINTISSNSASFANASVTNAFTVGTASYFVSNGNLGIGTASPINKLDIVGNQNAGSFRVIATDNIGDQGLDSVTLDVNISGSDTLTSTKNHNALRVDVDSTATGGNTTAEHVVRGVYTTVDMIGTSSTVIGHNADVRVNNSTGTLGDVYGAVNLIEVDPVTGGTVSTAYGSMNQAYAGGNGTITTIYGARNEAVIEVGATAGVGTAYGTFSEIEVDGNALNQAFAIRSVINIDGGVTTNGYLFYGDYQGANSTNITNPWGLYILGENSNYISGNVGIGNTAPAHKLRVQGDISLSGGIHANGSLGTAGQVLHSNGTSVYWDADDGTVTSIATGSGLTGGPITTTGTISVVANSGLSANATGIYVVAGNGIVTTNSTGVHVGAGNGITVNSTAVAVLANSGIVANSTGVFVNTAFVGTLTANNANNFNGQNAAFYTNATNISTGTLNTARLPATANITTAINVGANVNLTTSSINVGNSTVNVFINSTAISVSSDPLVQLSDIGTAPDQIPLNQYLGTLAYQSDSIAVANTFAIGNVATFASNGNVGIGNTTPAHKLRVQGDMSLSGGFQANGSLGTAGQVLTSNSTGVYWSSTGTIRIGTVASAATITPTSDTADQYNVTALATAATIAAPSGTPVDGRRLVLRLKDNGTSRALTWTTSSGAYRAIGVTLPTTTVATKTTYVGCIYNAADTFWDVVAVTTQV